MVYMGHKSNSSLEDNRARIIRENVNWDQYGPLGLDPEQKESAKITISRV